MSSIEKPRPKANLIKLVNPIRMLGKARGKAFTYEFLLSVYQGPRRREILFLFLFFKTQRQRSKHKKQKNFNEASASEGKRGTLICSGSGGSHEQITSGLALIYFGLFFNCEVFNANFLWDFEKWGGPPQIQDGKSLGYCKANGKWETHSFTIAFRKRVIPSSPTLCSYLIKF